MSLASRMLIKFYICQKHVSWIMDFSATKPHNLKVYLLKAFKNKQQSERTNETNENRTS